jgi:transcriptional regulator with XRE-family HTH domain
MPRPPRPSVDDAFGRVLAELRREAGYSQERLGNDSGTGRTFVSELERAKRGASLKTLFRLAPYLGVTPAEIVRRVEERLAETRRQAR